MTVSSGEVVKAVATHELLDNVISQSVWYWIVSSAAPVAYSTVLAAIKTEIETIYALMQAHIETDTHLTDLVVNKWEYNATEGWHTGALVGIDTLSDSFSSAADMLPHACAMTITGFTQDPNVRSRKSFGGFTEDKVLDSDVTAPVTTAMANALGEWLTARTLGGSDELLPGVPAATGVFEYLLYGLVSDLIGSQRQRKPGVGV